MQLLSITANAATKSSVALLLVRLLFLSTHMRGCYAVLAVSIIWGIASLTAQAIRCPAYPPWLIVGAVCPTTVRVAFWSDCVVLLTREQVASWTVVTVFNVTIEVVLALIPVWLVWNLQTSYSRKITVVAIFWLRIP